MENFSKNKLELRFHDFGEGLGIFYDDSCLFNVGILEFPGCCGAHIFHDWDISKEIEIYDKEKERYKLVKSENFPDALWEELVRLLRVEANKSKIGLLVFSFATTPKGKSVENGFGISNALEKGGATVTSERNPNTGNKISIYTISSLKKRSSSRKVG